MPHRLEYEQWDVLVVGGGAAGIGAAVAAARNGARVVLVDAGPMVGGELVSGIPVDGCLSSRGEWVVGGICRDLFEECDRLGGYIGPINDFRSLHVVAVDPEIMKIAVVNILQRAGVVLRLYSYADDVLMERSRVRGVVVVNKGRRVLIEAGVVIDASGDGDVAVAAGVPFELGDAGKGELQPVTLMFRMVGVDAERLLRFVRDCPDNFGLGEYDGLGRTKQECADALYRQGLPKAFLIGDGPVMRDAIARGELHRSSMIGITPTSLPRREVSLNTTRIGHLDATDTMRLSAALPDLVEQVWECAGFLQRRVPEFEAAVFSGMAPRIGIRETRRIMCDYVLTDEDVGEARKRTDGIAKGAHEIDVHLAGTGHMRRPIAGGGSYDIPYATLLARGVDNLFVVGRCMSATRVAHSSARVMGTCIAMGQAAGTAAAIATAANQPMESLRGIAVPRLREMLRSQGAVPGRNRVMARGADIARYDVVVVGSGSAGLAASIAAARNGARTLLVDAGPSIGGELLSGLPLNACLSARGEWVVGGVVRELLDRCAAMGGLVPPYFDWRSLWLVCVDPEIMKLACAMMAAEAGVQLLLNTFAEAVIAEDGAVAALDVRNKSGRMLLMAELFIDCSGDGDIAVAAGAPWEKGGSDGAFQPVTMMFRMQGVETGPLLDFVVAHPDYVGLGEARSRLRSAVPNAQRNCESRTFPRCSSTAPDLSSLTPSRVASCSPAASWRSARSLWRARKSASTPPASPISTPPTPTRSAGPCPS